MLLVISPERLFRNLVPFLIIGACLLLGLQDRIKAALPPRRPEPTRPVALSLRGAVFVSAIYGGYFGAGLGIISLAVLGLALDDPLPRLNALKQLIAASANVVAATFFLFSGHVEWALAAAMAPASLVGGQLGGRLVRSIPVKPLRFAVIAFGLAVAVKQWL